MKVAIFSECYLPTTNGVVTSIVTLRKTLEQMGHTVYIFAPGKPEREDDPFVYRLPQLPFPSHPYRWARPYPRLSFDFGALGVDLIHCQHPFSVGTLGLELGEKYGIPVVYTCHALYDDLAHYARSSTLRKVGPAILRTKMRKFCSRIDYVVAVSEYTRDQLYADRVNSRIVVVPSGVSPVTAQPGARERIRRVLGLSQGDRVILATGRLSPEKRIDVLLRSFAVLKAILSPAEAASVKLVLVGDGGIKRDLYQLSADLGITDSVIFAGKKPHNQIGDWYAAADIFAWCSPVETQGLVFVEAMSMGLPCIATNQGGPREIVVRNKTGLQVPLDAGAYAQAMRTLLMDPELCEEMGRNGRIEAQKYTPEAMVKGVLKVYNAALYGPQMLHVDPTEADKPGFAVTI